MIKPWISKAIAYLQSSLSPVPQELNELDWKSNLSPKKDKLCQHLCAFANLPGGGFLIFGIEDKTGTPAGVDKKVADKIVEQLANLCRAGVEPLVSMDHSMELFDGCPLLFVYIKESAVKPVHLFHKSIEDSFIRSGGTTRPASRLDVAALLLNSKTPVFEELHASTLKNATEVMTLLDIAGIHALLKKPTPSNEEEIIYWLQQEKMIEDVDGKGFYITNFGALAAAQNLSQFDGLARKAVRVIQYEGKTKTQGSKEFPDNKGYAIGFEELIQFLKGILPGSEVIRHALRTDASIYPEIALRELIANALIHQDFTIRGSGPMIEVFSDRIEISSPGKLLPGKKIDRLIRATPESRNEVLAAAFRRFNICEERGSGFEKAITAIELFGLPPLKVEETDSSFKVIMYSPKTFAEMTREERIEACYQHSIIQYYGAGGMNNTSLRKRFGMHDKQSPQISLLIKEAVNAGKIKIKDPESSKKFAVYLPYWV
ncbi:MAG: putative DNA binding domain-containing protein [Gammaproteobacteria bacterium]|nr:putative DNA binding domain-containing protein [Gammaproteobacteria bacterium]